MNQANAKFESSMQRLEQIVRALERGDAPLDESLKLHETVYPAAGTDHSAVRLTIDELEHACPDAEWIDVCRV